jgi:hypothetical protein
MNGNGVKEWIGETQEMTAIAVVYTKAGFVVAADGLSLAHDAAGVTLRVESENEQKIFKGRYKGTDFAWAIAGTAFNEDRSFNLVNVVNKFLLEDFTESLGAWTEALASWLLKGVAEARQAELIPPFRRNKHLSSNDPQANIFATILVAGYLRDGAKPAVAMIQFFFEGATLTTPIIRIRTPPSCDVFSGSNEMARRYFQDDPDKRFRKYYQPSGKSVETGIAHAKGFIEACSDPLARDVDPFCESIGGHIHVATVTPRDGFSWAQGLEPNTT